MQTAYPGSFKIKMGKIIDLHARLLRATPAAVESRSLEIIRAEQKQILDLNRQQLDDSITSDGEPLGEYASIAYANRKGRSTVDLKLTGAFHDSFFINADKYPIAFNATDKKTSGLVERYGEEIFGLTQANKREVSQEIIRIGLINWLREILHV